MRNTFPLWKNLLILSVFVLAVIYALPNVFGDDPSVQHSPLRATKLDQATLTQVDKLLTDAGLKPRALELTEKRLLIRFADTDAQLRASDLLQTRLGSNHTVALNLAPATPAWLRGLGAQPMYLGLDLRGGVHFLMQVDMTAAVRQAEERYVEDLRTLLRESKIRYVSVERENQAIAVKFQDNDAMKQARDVINREVRGLE